MLWAVLGASMLLLVGFVLRANLRVLQWLFVPASVVGGILGLLLVQIATYRRPDGGTLMPEAAASFAGALGAEWRAWPGALIAVVFAGLLLERPNARVLKSPRGPALAAIMVWIIVLGQVALGLTAAWLLILPAHDVPPAFGQLIEAGFAGGHGTATALGTIFTVTLSFPDGMDLGLFMATVGLVYSVISGIVFVNIGVRRGWTRSGTVELRLTNGLEPRTRPEPIALGRVGGEVIDPFAFSLLLVAMAMVVGIALKSSIMGAGRLVLRDDYAEYLEYLDNLPLFLFALLGGFVVRKTMTMLRVDDLIDTASIKRIVGVAMEFLIVAAIASLRVEVVKTYAWPLALLLVLAFAWTAACLLLSRRVLPGDHWFELGILNYGMSTGTTAQGLMLLRIIDRDFESGAAEEFALAAPFSAPFIGGGLLTLSLPLILERVGMPLIIGVLATATVVLYAVGRRLRGPIHPH